MSNITPDDIQNIRDFETLLDFLRNKLGWRIPEDVELEDVAFPWSAEDLDLDEPTEERIVDCKQLSPFPPAELSLGLIEETQPWGIFFLQFNSESVYRTALRRVLRGLVERRDQDASLPAWEHDQLLFICTTADFQRFAFAHFSANENWRRSVLSIFSWEQGDTHIRTLCEYNLPALTFPYEGFSDDQVWLKAWQDAFDVEAVTDKFFADYQRVFAQVEDAVEGVPENDTEARRLYTQRLFNRLMFLRFIEKKGWLTYNGDRDYLRVLFDATEAETDENFLNDRLYWAFFNGLGSPGGSTNDQPEIVERRGEVPFLNGGLFEMQAYDKCNDVHIPNEKFAEILKLFERYNFTVTESTPLDVEVAVDPEMLGKVFEELVTGRHDTGSYYTPRPVVSFMCRESLKICLQNKTDETPETLKKFVDDGDATEIRNPEKVLHVLQTLRICDPACGSGAYLLGMMGELLRLRNALFQSRQVDPKSTYQRKLEIIQNNLYGVDKDEFAVNIAMLRLWLSLAVDYEGDTPEPLPNLEYKVATGDSLTGPAPEPPKGQIRPEDYLIQQIQEHQAEYLITHNDPDKQRLREEIADLKESLEGWQENAEGFVWRVEFPEVFQEGGFDIVIGNPPYLRQERIIPIKPTLEQLFSDVFARQADLYIFFYKRGTELICVNGVLTYISSNKFLRAGYGKKLRKFFTDDQCIHRLIDFGSVQVFKASVDTCIILVENVPPSSEAFLAATFRDEADVSRLSIAFQEQAFSMYPRDLSPEGWVLASSDITALLTRLQCTGTQLYEHIQGRLYFGIKTGCNEAFIIDEAKREELITQDPKSAEIIKPLLRGRDITRYRTQWANLYLLFIPWHFPLHEDPEISGASKIAEIRFKKGYPSAYNHLLQYKNRLSNRNKAETGIRYEWYALQRCANTYLSEFEKPKIIYPDISPIMRACYDTTKTYCLQTTYILPTEDLSLLAILNSQLIDWYARHKFQSLNDPWAGGGLRFIAQYMRRVPIADRTDAQKAELSRLVDQILADPESGGVREIEQQIDALVYQLYGLTETEIELIKQTYRDAGMEV